ncbi:MAG TPA: DciA family protein [Reyranella sp.]|nr:DciA family protein [Reyranella sp.]
MRENGFRAIGGLAQGLTGGLVQAKGKGRGLQVARLKVEWPAIVGPEIARVCEPDALLPGRSRTGGKALRLRVLGAAALELQHKAGLLVERVNGYVGHRAIEEIRLVQGALSGPPPKRMPPPLDKGAAARVAERLDGMEESELKAALARLGARVSASRRSIVLGALATPFVARRSSAQANPPAGQPQPSPEQRRALFEMPHDHALGKKDAPNLLIDYFSLTCPHCANFHAAIFPVIKSKWIDTGKLRFIYRHFPSDSIATHASQFAECAGADKFFDAIGVLFHAQVDWLTSGDPEAEMAKVLDKAGLPSDRCLANDQLLDKVIEDVQSGQVLGVKATPTVIINGDGTGSPTAETINQILEKSGR